jgi:amino acid adenylation domain-containing protein
MVHTRVSAAALALAAPSVALAGTVRGHGVHWSRPKSDVQELGDAYVTKPNSTFGFQFSDDFRDPNDADAWGGEGNKLLFLVIYAALWGVLCLIVHFWPNIEKVAKRCRPKVAQARVLIVAPLTSDVNDRPLLERGDVDEANGKEWNVGETPAYPSEKLVIELFGERAKATPNAIALVLPDTSQKQMTYQALNAAVEELSNALLGLGFTCGTVAALILDRSVAQIVGVFGVLRSGASYLPIDAEAPAARKQFLVINGDASVVIGVLGDEPTQQLSNDVGGHVHFFALPEDGRLGAMTIQKPRPPSNAGSFRSRPNSFCNEPGPVEFIRPTEDEMAMLIYTSGTTGQPKGIVYDQRHLMHGVYFFGYQCDMDSNSVAFLKSPYFWAVIEWEMFPALTLGGKLVVASPQGHRSAEYLTNTVARNQITVLMITPQVLDLVIDVHEVQQNAKPLNCLQHIVTVGEPLNCSLANRAMALRGLDARLHNFYGASESSCTVYTVPKEGMNLTIFPKKVPAGTPQPHSKVYVMRIEEKEESLNEGSLSGKRMLAKLVPVPTGEAGEICFGGVLAACYWKHEELTAEKWVDTPMYGRLYRTGDLGRWKAGVIEVIGRTDRQVKVRGVRIEPEEVECILKQYATAAPGVQDLELGAESTESPTSRLALKEVAVVASAEPSELVAFVTLRAPSENPVTVDALRAYCQANLTPAYVPKFYVILDAMPKLPNGKNNLSELKIVASQHVVEEGEVVMDSLGQMKKLSKWAILENQVIHRCYAFWMIGVLTDHYDRCAIDADPFMTVDTLYPFCSILARKSVQPWSEIVVRSFFGNDQDMFGFIMLGAYQDSRPVKPGGPPRVNLGLKDCFIFLVYILMALPFPQAIHAIFGSWGWPKYWGGSPDDLSPPPVNEWNYDYMQYNSYTSDHRWYLIMVLMARIYLQIMETCRAPGWLQGVLVLIPCFLTYSEAFNVCEGVDTQGTSVKYVFSWIFRNFGTSCAMYYKWVQWYMAAYVWCFHYLRAVVNYASNSTFLPKGRTYAAAAFGLSMMIGVLMAMFHYPNDVVETGTNLQWAWLEVGVDFIQPGLIVFAMAYFPFDLAWWGNTTLGCYCFHYYFKDQAGTWIQDMSNAFDWDRTGILLPLSIFSMCICFTTFMGPLGHYLLLAPALFYGWIARMLARRN